MNPSLSAPLLLRTISVDERDCPPLIILVQPTSKPSKKRMRTLHDSVGNHSYPSSLSFAPETVESAGELCDLYRQVWREQVFPLADKDASSFSRGTKRKLSLSGEVSGDNFCQGFHDDDDDVLSIFSMDDLDTLFSEVDSVKVRRCQITASQEGGEDSSATENDPISLGSNQWAQDGTESMAASVDTMYSFDTEFSYNVADGYR
jgi:hypothetical protein